MKNTIKRWALIFTFATLLLSPVELTLLAQQHRPVTPAPTKSTQPAVDNTTQPSTTKSQSDETSDPAKLKGSYIAAAIAAAASISAALIALGSAWLSVKHAKRNQESLARLTSDLTQQNQEVTARREYASEARKRLYQECEPLIFQFVELSENALYRIHSLARTARRGNLPNWLCENDYYIASTMYHLLAPMVIYNRRFAHFPSNLLKSLDRGFPKSVMRSLQPIDFRGLIKMTEPWVIN